MRSSVHLARRLSCFAVLLVLPAVRADGPPAVTELRTQRMGSVTYFHVRFEQPPASVEVEGARLVKLSGAGAKLVVDTGRRPIRSVLDDLLDRYDVVDISVADPPLEEIVSHIYARPV